MLTVPWQRPLWYVASKEAMSRWPSSGKTSSRKRAAAEASMGGTYSDVVLRMARRGLRGSGFPSPSVGAAPMRVPASAPV